LRRGRSGGRRALLARGGCLCRAPWLGGRRMWLRRSGLQGVVGGSEVVKSSGSFDCKSFMRLVGS
jgi:hypothetical protein